MWPSPFVLAAVCKRMLLPRVTFHLFTSLFLLLTSLASPWALSHTCRLSAWSSLAPELTEDGVVPLNLLFCRVPPRWGLPAGVPGPPTRFAPGSQGPCARPLHLVFLLPNVCNPDPQASLLQIVFRTPLPWRAPDWRRFASPSESILCFTVIFFFPLRFLFDTSHISWLHGFLQNVRSLMAAVIFQGTGTSYKFIE